MGYDMNVPLEQTIALEKVNPVTDSALPNSFGGGLTMLELVNKLLRVVNGAVVNDIAMSNNFTNLLAAFEALRGYVAENGFGDGSITSDMIARYAVTRDKLANYVVDASKIDGAAILEQHLSQFCVAAYAIKNGAVVNEKIADGAVTTDKLAPLSVGFNELAKNSVKGDRILAQSIESYHINNGAIGAAHIMNGNVTNEKIADGHVSTEKLADGAVTTDKLAPLSVGFNQLARNSVKGDRILDQSIESYHIKYGAITAGHIMNGQVISEKIANGHVTTQKLANGAVTADKIADSAFKPLVLYADLANEYPSRYLQDSTYGDLALQAIMRGRQILVRVPPARFVSGGKDTPADYAAQHTALFAPILSYQLPNNADNEYLYLYYLRDEKEWLDLNALGRPPVALPVYGQLKLKVTVTYADCPLDNLTGQEYYDIVHGGTH